MSLEITALPLAWFAGVLSILSPCVWPLIPVVMSSASISGRAGPIYLSLGLMSSFAAAGSFITYLFLNLGLDPEWLRYFGASLFLFIAITLLVKPLGQWVTMQLSRLTAGMYKNKSPQQINAAGQFIIGMTLGIVWLPCVGPTVGAAIALASMGQNMAMAFSVLLAFAFGTASVLLLAGLGSNQLLKRWQPQIMQNSQRGKTMLGVVLLVFAVLTLSGLDKILEGWV
jgi:cytochrome c-type biogenesis protein